MSKILLIISYKFYPPTNGGSLRCFYLLREMARKNEVSILTIQPNEDFTKVQYPLFPENVRINSIHGEIGYRSVFNTLFGKTADAINYRFLRRSLRGNTNSYFLHTYPPLLKALKTLKPDIVFYENLEAVGFFSNIVNRQLPSSKQLYDAHNIDSELWTQLATLQQSSVFKKYAENALQIETYLYKSVDAFCCCSEVDRGKLLALNQGRLPGFTIPNGVDTDAKPFDYNPLKHSNKEILFCGSLDYYPNEEGLIWFYDHVFPLIKKAIPEVVLTLIGSSEKNEKNRKLWDDSSVSVEGSVASLQPFYYRAGICIAPLLSGSGTRLKILEAMSFGNPIVSTSVGAEGINIIQGKHLLIADDPFAFAEMVIDLLLDQDLFEATRINARELVCSDYEWGKIGLGLNEVLQQVTLSHTPIIKNDLADSFELIDH
jgi:glycosyltransferase involved in cell wall biosynthesis